MEGKWYLGRRARRDQGDFAAGEPLPVPPDEAATAKREARLVSS